MSRQVIDEIDDELLCHANVAGGVFGHAGGAITWTKTNDGGAVAQDVEKAEWGGIDAAMFIHGGGQRDWAWCDKSGKDEISVIP
jgi:hypothetical protein